MDTTEHDPEASDLGIGQKSEGQPEWRQEEVAYEDAKRGFPLFDFHLRPYSPSRKVSANCMGMLYPFISAEAWDQFQMTGSYAGMLKDAIILLWLCTLPDPSDLTLEQVKAQAWTPQRASSKPSAAYEEALAWAEKLGMIDMVGKPWREARQVFMAINNNIAAGDFVLEQEESSMSSPTSEVSDPKV